eukprot:gnl/TRDRNA2_/TRDRNA2_189041_c0_seq1.p1 gnl/TRDRNA2_/TRDRNA2_189041_c0~~gnl/TRDRNA2_/TRDRNA2_189041_c0_seq1.p1  ORF type:complete len:866 (+),score=232.08 gnl/TRDRNA2_/TRDRNA2_189041_c0_seq1:63-2660(+)
MEWLLGINQEDEAANKKAAPVPSGDSGSSNGNASPARPSTGDEGLRNRAAAASKSSTGDAAAPSSSSSNGRGTPPPRVGTAAGAACVAAGLTNTNPEVRLAAAEMLGALGAVSAEHVDTLKEIVKTDSTERVRTAAAAALRKIDPSAMREIEKEDQKQVLQIAREIEMKVDAPPKELQGLVDAFKRSASTPGRGAEAYRLLKSIKAQHGDKPIRFIEQGELQRIQRFGARYEEMLELGSPDIDEKKQQGRQAWVRCDMHGGCDEGGMSFAYRIRRDGCLQCHLSCIFEDLDALMGIVAMCQVDCFEYHSRCLDEARLLAETGDSQLIYRALNVNGAYEESVMQVELANALDEPIGSFVHMQQDITKPSPDFPGVELPEKKYARSDFFQQCMLFTPLPGGHFKHSWGTLCQPKSSELWVLNWGPSNLVGPGLMSQGSWWPAQFFSMLHNSYRQFKDREVCESKLKMFFSSCRALMEAKFGPSLEFKPRHANAPEPFQGRRSGDKDVAVGGLLDSIAEAGPADKAADGSSNLEGTDGAELSGVDLKAMDRQATAEAFARAASTPGRMLEAYRHLQILQEEGGEQYEMLDPQQVQRIRDFGARWEDLIQLGQPDFSKGNWQKREIKSKVCAEYGKKISEPVQLQYNFLIREDKHVQCHISGMFVDVDAVTGICAMVQPDMSKGHSRDTVTINNVQVCGDNGDQMLFRRLMTYGAGERSETCEETIMEIELVNALDEGCGAIVYLEQYCEDLSESSIFPDAQIPVPEPKEDEEPEAEEACPETTSTADFKCCMMFKPLPNGNFRLQWGCSFKHTMVAKACEPSTYWPTKFREFILENREEIQKREIEDGPRAMFYAQCRELMGSKFWLH